MNDIDQIVDKLKKDNFVIIKNFFDRNVLSKIKAEIKILKDTEMHKRDKHYIKVEDNLILSSMHNIHLYSAYYKNLILDSKLRDIVKLRYGSTSKRIFNSSLLLNLKTLVYLQKYIKIMHFLI